MVEPLVWVGLLRGRLRCGSREHVAACSSNPSLPELRQHYQRFWKQLLRGDPGQRLHRLKPVPNKFAFDIPHDEIPLGASK